jgi:pSer/pThr/pTyr-binding forkhead associated (FHA) protein
MSLSVNGPYGLDTVEYIGRELLLGRQDVKTRVFPDVNLDDGASSRRHLSIWKEIADGFFYAQDLESSNGTYLNDLEMPAGDPIQLKNGDVIKIGTRYNIKVNIS